MRASGLLLATAVWVTQPPPLTIERLQWSKDVDGPDPVTAIEVRNDFGDIRARFSGDRRLEAWMVVQRLDPGPERVGYTVERRGSVVALVVGYPPGRVRDADPRPPKDSYDRLDLTLYVPEGVALHAQTLRGQVEARGLKSDVEAATLDGPIFVTSTGRVDARTSAGPITALLDAALTTSVGPPLLFQSVSGPIALTLLADARPELRIETAGEISTSLPLRRQRSAGRQRATSAPRGVGRLVLVSSDTGRVTIERQQ